MLYMNLTNKPKKKTADNTNLSAVENIKSIHQKYTTCPNSADLYMPSIT